MSTMMVAIATGRLALFSSQDFNHHFEPDIDMRMQSYVNKLHAADVFEGESVELGHYNIHMWLETDLNTAYGQQRLWSFSNMGDHVATLMMGNPHYQPFFSSLPEGDFFAGLAPHIFQLTPRLHQQAQQWRDQHWKRFMVGVQVRYKHITFNASRLPQLQDYAHLAISLATRLGGRNSEVGFFIAADNAAAYEQVRALLGEERVLYTHNGIADRAQPLMSSIANPGTMESALLDFWLLSECHEIIATQGSSYGLAAAAYSNKRAYIMIHGPHQQRENPVYYHALTSEMGSWLLPSFFRSGSEEQKALFKNNVPHWMDLAARH